jgi:hypothetical protein
MFKQTAMPKAIFYPEFKECWEGIEKLHKEQKDQFEAKNFMLLGVSGVGKSTLIGKYLKNCNDQASIDSDRRPVVSFRVPASPTVKSLMQEVVRVFKGPDGGTAVDLMRRAIQYVNHFKVEILLMDEAHHLIDRGRMKTHAHLGDCLKEFNDQVDCAIGLCGARRLKLLFETNNQLRNRWSSSFVLRPFSYTDGQQALASFIQALMQGSISKGNEGFFHRIDTINRIQYATDGVPALVVKLMQNVKQVMASSGEMSLLVMDQAWNFPCTSHLPARRRPFHKNFNFERLMGIDEPFFPSSFDGDNHAN